MLPPKTPLPTDSQVSLNTNCEDEEDTQTHHDPEHQLYKHISETKCLKSSVFSQNKTEIVHMQ